MLLPLYTAAQSEKKNSHHHSNKTPGACLKHIIKLNLQCLCETSSRHCHTESTSKATLGTELNIGHSYCSSIHLIPSFCASQNAMTWGSGSSIYWMLEDSSHLGWWGKDIRILSQTFFFSPRIIFGLLWIILDRMAEVCLPTDHVLLWQKNSKKQQLMK